MNTIPMNSSLAELLNDRKWVSSLARSIVHDSHTADDVSQEAWLSALSQRSPISHPRACLELAGHEFEAEFEVTEEGFGVEGLEAHPPTRVVVVVTEEQGSPQREAHAEGQIGQQALCVFARLVIH